MTKAERKALREAVLALSAIDVQVTRDMPPIEVARYSESFSRYERFEMPPATIHIRNGAGTLIDRDAILALLDDPA